MTRPRARIPALALLAALAGGCSVLPEAQPQRHFVLPASSQQPSTAATLPLVLQVQTPQAAQPLASSRIAVQPRPNETSVYAGARWADDAPSLLRDHLIDAFRRNGRLSAAISDDSGARSDVILASQLNAFHAGYEDGDTPWLLVRMDVQLLNSGNRRIIASTRFEQRLSSRSARIEDVVDGLGDASDALARELVAWSLDRLETLPLNCEKQPCRQK